MFSTKQMEHGIETFDDDVFDRALRTALKEQRGRGKDVERVAVELLPGLNTPYAWLPGMPASGVRSDKGHDVGGFPDSMQSEVWGSDMGALKARMLEANKACGRVWSSNGGGRKALRERESLTAQIYGNVRLDVTFAVRAGLRAGLKADVEQVRRELMIAGKEHLEKLYPGVHVVAVLLHPPNPMRDAAERKAGKLKGKDKATGLNWHLQFYVTLGLNNEFTSPMHGGFAHGNDSPVALFQQNEMGVDVATQQAAKHKIWLNRLYRQMTPIEMERADPKTGARFCSAEQAVEVMATRAAVERGETTFEKAIDGDLTKWMAGRKEAILAWAEKDLQKSKLNQKPYKWEIADFATKFLLRRLPEIRSEWQGRLAWAAQAAKAVFAERAAGGRSRPHYAILRDIEEADDARKLQAEHDAKLAAERERAVFEARSALEDAEAERALLVVEKKDLEAKLEVAEAAPKIDPAELQALRQDAANKDEVILSLAVSAAIDAIGDLSAGREVSGVGRKVLIQDPHAPYGWRLCETLRPLVTGAMDAPVSTGHHELSQLEKFDQITSAGGEIAGAAAAVDALSRGTPLTEKQLEFFEGHELRQDIDTACNVYKHRAVAPSMAMDKDFMMIAKRASGLLHDVSHAGFAAYWAKQPKAVNALAELRQALDCVERYQDELILPNKLPVGLEQNPAVIGGIDFTAGFRRKVYDLGEVMPGAAREIQARLDDLRAVMTADLSAVTEPTDGDALAAKLALWDAAVRGDGPGVEGRVPYARAVKSKYERDGANFVQQQSTTKVKA